MQEEEVPLIDRDVQARRAKQLSKNKCAIWVLGVCAVFFLLLTLLSWFAVRPLVDWQIQKKTLVDSPSAQGYGLWAGESGVPDTFYQMWVWNVENPQEAANGSEKIRLREVGPYTFREYRKKINVTFSDDGNVVQYYQYQYYVFDQEKSGPGLLENDTFLTGNVALQGVRYSPQLAPLNLIKQLTGIPVVENLAHGLLCQAWEQEMAPGYDNPNAQFTPFVQVPVADYFFGMKNEPVLTILSGWVNRFRASPVGSLLPAGALNPVTTDFPGLGVLNLTSENDTLTRSNINIQYTGKKDNNQKSQYIKWQNMTDVYVCPLPPPRSGDHLVNCPHFQTEWDESTANKNGWVQMWKTDEAMRVQGTDMINWPRNQHDNELLGFVDPLFRWAKVKAEWTEEKALPEFHGAAGKRFTLRPEDMYNSTIFPDNDMFFGYGPSGLLNMTRKAGLPFFVSKPHFLGADERLRNAVIGMNPDEEKHGTWFIKNELLGQTIAAHQAVQLNVLLEDVEFRNSDNCSFISSILTDWPCCSAEMSAKWSGSWKLNKTGGIDEGVILPIVHILESFTLTEDQAKQIIGAETLYHTVPIYGPIVGFSLVAVMLFGLVVLYIQRRKIILNQDYDDDEGVSDGDRIRAQFPEHYHHHHQNNEA
eukprot:TRINITY_DN1156_c0_g1_i1.p1 TRINITY_DN1156_c0_g1~~TRINITY_DN1156_c0_g1_i1.p1  ORF type:complete len:665 (+),score=194.05 TRINITY_DN1156_c0_g1_i1:59-1996(+)